jgi:AraC family carnitine catabolism transcriptional activator
MRFAFLLIPQFSMMSFAAAIEPLRAANRLAGRALFQWELLSRDGAPVAASNGIVMAADLPLAQLRSADVVLACMGLEPLQCHSDRPLHNQLRLLAARGARIGGISTAPFLLAEAGLLERKRCTVHWEYAERFRQRYPSIALVEELFVIDGQICTCSGGTAAMDMVLDFIRQDTSADLAASVAEQFIHPRIRAQGDPQRMGLRARYPLVSARLLRIIAQMEAAVLAGAPRLAEIAARNGVSLRHMERLFRTELNASPRTFYVKLRLDRSRVLLATTSASIFEVAMETGFKSASHFSHTYKRVFGVAPRQERTRAAAGLTDRS